MWALIVADFCSHDFFSQADTAGSVAAAHIAAAPVAPAAAPAAAATAGQVCVRLDRGGCLVAGVGASASDGG